MIASQDRWLHTPKAKKALTESLAWAAKIPARVSDLSALKKKLYEDTKKSADGTTMRFRCEIRTDCGLPYKIEKPIDLR